MKRYICLLAVVLIALTGRARAETLLDIDSGKAQAALLINVETKQVVFEKNADAPCEAAGLKRLPALMTVCSAFDEGYIDPDTVVTVSEEASRIRGATAFISANERIRAGELLKAAVILNAGDAICALLTAVYGGEAGALEAVNAELAALEIPSLSNSLGEGREFSLRELSTVSMELIRSEAFLSYSSVYMDSVPHENAKDTELVNPNRLVRHYSGCFGVATGSIGSAQYSAAVAAKRGTTTFIALAAGLPDSKTRFKLVTDMLDAGFAAYRAVSAGEAGASLGTVRVKGGSALRVEAVLGDGAFVLLPAIDAKIKTRAELPDEITAPVYEGAEIGRLIMENSTGEAIGSVPLCAKTGVPEASFLDEFMKLVHNWLRLD